MTPRRIVALFAASRCAGPDALEFLRILAALAACDRPLLLVEVGAGRGALDAPDLAPEVERYVDALAGFDVVPRALDDDQLAAALADAAAVLCFSDPGRRAEPPVLDLADADEAPAAAELTEAGQVIR